MGHAASNLFSNSSKKKKVLCTCHFSISLRQFKNFLNTPEVSITSLMSRALYFSNDFYSILFHEYNFFSYLFSYLFDAITNYLQFVGFFPQTFFYFQYYFPPSSSFVLLCFALFFFGGFPQMPVE